MNSNEIRIPINLEAWLTYSLVFLCCILVDLLFRRAPFLVLKFSNRLKPTIWKVQFLSIFSMKNASDV